MKTDDEMIKSLFERREEYYAKSTKKSFVMAAVKVVLKTAAPVAAAGTAAFFLILAQKNIPSDNYITRGEITGILSSGTAEKNDNIPNYTETHRLTASPPLCFSFGGQIYAAAEEQSDNFKKYAALNLTEAGAASVLETAPEEAECIVYKLNGSDLKALKTEDGIKLYRPVGKSTYTVGGWEFEIKALHRTAEKYAASALPVCREGEDIVFRAYDVNGKPVNNIFILYTTELLDFDSVLWEACGNIPENELYNYPDIDFMQYSSLMDFCEKIRLNGYNAYDLIDRYGCNTDIVIDGKLSAMGIQIYYTDLNYIEYVLEAYSHSEEIVITRMATGESVFITDDICDIEGFLNPDNVHLSLEEDNLNDG